MVILKYLPAMLVCIISVCIVITFTFAYKLGHVTYLVPYISDSGTYPPESCIFGLLMNLVNIALAFLTYVRYLQVEAVSLRYGFFVQLEKLNKISLILGLFMSTGCAIIGCFQETEVLVVHWFGAILLFCVGSAYQCIQMSLSFKMYPSFGNRPVIIFRAVSAVGSTIFSTIFFFTGMVACVKFHGQDPTKWKHEDGGFSTHVISTTTEWICTFHMMLFWLSFQSDFAKITIRPIKVSFVDNNAVVIKDC